jgi:hypothetical protein
MNEVSQSDLMFVAGVCLPDVADKYTYPMEEWANIGSMDEAVKVYQLPDDVLKNISTVGLIRSFLDIPVLHSSFFLSSNTSCIGTMDRIYPFYNSAQELMDRKDAGRVLLAYFDAICFDCLSGQDTIDQMDWDSQVEEAGKQLELMAQLAVIQVFFAQQKILDQYNYKDKQKVVSRLLSKYEQIQELSIKGFYDPAALEVMACVMYHAQYQPVVEYFGTQHHFDITADKVEDIISFAKQFIR